MVILLTVIKINIHIHQTKYKLFIFNFDCYVLWWCVEYIIWMVNQFYTYIVCYEHIVNLKIFTWYKFHVNVVVFNICTVLNLDICDNRIYVFLIFAMVFNKTLLYGVTVFTWHVRYNHAFWTSLIQSDLHISWNA